VRDLAFQVEAQFVFEVAFHGPAGEDRPKTVDKIAEHSGALEYLPDGGYQAAPGFGFLVQLSSAGAGELVIFGSPVVVGHVPRTPDPTTALEPVEGRIKRALLDLQRLR
jgi:hypothetical protein